MNNPSTFFNGIRLLLTNPTRSVRFILLLCALISSNTFANGALIKILPLGDSITEGVNGQISYRRDLWFQLLNANYSVDFIGSKFGVQSTVDPALLDFDLNHEGQSAIQAGQMLAQSALPTWLLGYQADMVLLHAGTNDIQHGQSNTSTLNELAGVISLLRADNPQIIIFIAKIIPMQHKDVVPFNTALEAWLPGQVDPNSPIILVDQFTDIDPIIDLVDRFHPNTFGEEKMATRWYDVLEPYLIAFNRLPLVSAGPDRIVSAVNDTIILQGSVSGRWLTYRFVIITAMEPIFWPRNRYF